jgi:ribosomal protein S18 acetylase RimI-like enzyme
MEAAMASELTLTTRQAEMADVPRLARINQELIRHEWDGVNKEFRYLEKRLEQWIGDPSYSATIFERGGRVVAYALIRLFNDESYIRHFYVEPEMRRAGIGKAVCKKLLEDVLPTGMRVSLHVLAVNSEGAEFWRSMGFRDYSIEMERYTNAASNQAA